MEKKSILSIVILLLFCFQGTAQNDKYRFSVGFGLANGYFKTLNTIKKLDYSTPSLGKGFEFSFDFLLSEGRSVGIGYAMQSKTRTVDDSQLLFYDTGLLFDNYRLENETQFYDVHFRKQFEIGVGLAVGAFFYQNFQGNLGIESDGLINGERLYSFSDFKTRGDDFGLSAAADYLFVLKSGVSLGLQARVFYSFAGIEAFSITPMAAFTF